MAKNVKRPKARAIHTDPDCAPTPEEEPLPDALAEEPVEDKSPARWAFERLALYIKNFEKQLDPEQEVAIGFTGSDGFILRIEGVGYFDPDIVTFYGQDRTGARSQLIQHVTQLSVALRAMPKPTEEKAARRIGFRLAESLGES